jgi:hypothetical protein
MEGWEAFATVTGSTAGVIVGLLFVAVSIRAHVIAADNKTRFYATSALHNFVVACVGCPGDAWPEPYGARNRDT